MSFLYECAAKRMNVIDVWALLVMINSEKDHVVAHVWGHLVGDK